MADALFIGLMSGTSMDGVDGVLIDLAPGAGMRILGHDHQPYDAGLRQELLALNQPGDNELHRAALAANAVSRAYADVVSRLLQRCGLTPSCIVALGAHGQTVRHRPLEFDGVGYTVQLLNPALLAERTGIAVVSDLRSRDLAAGGQGAPLVPAFHHAAFGATDEDRAVLNLGGIANVTLLPADGVVSGHDCGPGNVLLDLWCERHTGRTFDESGRWAREGRRHSGLLQAMLNDGYIRRAPPKSTGRDHFHAAWLDTQLGRFDGIHPQDVQCTLAHFTAAAAASAVRTGLPTAARLLVCGGGAFNSFVMELLAAELPTLTVQTIAAVSALDPMHVEAAAFAWLAQRHCEQRPGNEPSVTGARGGRVLGQYQHG